MEIRGKLISDVSLLGGGLIPRQYLKFHDGDNVTIELPPVDFSKIKDGDDLLIKIKAPDLRYPAFSDSDYITFCGIRINKENIVAYLPQPPKPSAKLPEKVEYKGEYSFFADLHKECFVVAEDMLIIKKELNELIDYITELRKELDYLKQSNLSN